MILSTLIVFILSCSVVMAGQGMGPGPGCKAYTSGPCTTPATGAYFNEGFLGTANDGYENTGWVTYQGTGGTVNANYTLTNSPPSGSCTEGLLTALTAGGEYAAVFRDFGSTHSFPVDIYIEFRVDSYTLPANGDLFRVMKYSPSSDQTDSAPLWFHIGKDGSGNLIIGNDGGDVALSAGWHTIKLHAESTSTNSYYQLDGGTQIPYDRGSAGVPQYLFLGSVQLVDADEAFSIQWGRVWID